MDRGTVGGGFGGKGGNLETGKGTGWRQVSSVLRIQNRHWGNSGREGVRTGCGVAHLGKWEVKRCRRLSFPSHAIWGQSGSPDS